MTATQTVDRMVGLFEVQLRPHTARDINHREHGRLTVRTATAEPMTVVQQVELASVLTKYLTAKKLDRIRELAQTNGGFAWHGVGLEVTGKGASVDIDPQDHDTLVEQIEKIGE